MSRSLLAPLVAFTLTLVAVTPAQAAISVGNFVSRAQALRQMGIGAMLDPDFQLLRGEAQTATNALKADRAARAAAGKPPIACVPEGESIGITDMIDGLARLPAAAQRLPLKDGYARVLAQRFPCK